MHRYDRRAAGPIPLDRQEIEELADRILKGLKPYLKFRPEHMGSPMWSARGFSPSRWQYDVEGGFQTTNVRNHPVRVEVHVNFQRPTERGRDYVTGGGVQSKWYADSRGRATGYGLHLKLTVHLNPERSANEFLDELRGDVRKELLSVLRHEVTHLKDLLKYDPLPEAADDLAHAQAYHNKPSEVRAFMRQIVDEAIEYAHEQGRDDPFWISSLTRQFVEQAMDSAPTWQRIKDTLAPSNERKLIEAVSRALAREWPRLQELYPQDPEDAYDAPLPLPGARVAARWKQRLGQAGS